MIISHRHRFVFFHNPKTAGMSLRAVLAPFHDDPMPLHGILHRPPFDHEMDYAHLRLWETAVLFPQVIATARKYRSLIFVRDPYRRFVSAIDQHFKTNYPDVPLPTMPPEQQLLVIEPFVERILRPDALRTDHSLVHFSPQTWYLHSDGLRLSADIVPMDDRGAFIARGFASLGLVPQDVPHDNRSRSDLTHVLRSPKIRAFVRDFYADDFAFFAADPALAHLADQGPATGGRQEHRTSGIDKAARSSLATGLKLNSRDQAAALDPSELTSVTVTAADPTAAGTHKPLEAADLAAVSAELDRSAADLAAGRPREAFDRVRRVLADNPGYARALGLLGQIAVYADHPAIGLASLQRAFALDPRLEHRIWLALCLAKLDCAADAMNVMTPGIDTMPPTANAHFAAGMVLHALGQYDEAARCYARCAALDATRADARYRHGRALQAAGRIEPAIDAYTDAIGNDSTQADYHADLSAALSDLGRFEEARAAGQAAVQRDPGCVVAHNNIGHALHSLNRAAEAVIAYQHAIDGCDTYPRAQFGQALALLKSGDFERGWRQYEWRWRDGQTPRPDPGGRRWRGEDIRGQTILLHAEQGLGDTLQFVRFAPLVAARGARVVLEVPVPLVGLLRGVNGVGDVVASGDSIPPIDWHCPMASLPLAFDLRLETIPASPYLPRPLDQTGPPGEASNERQGLVVGLVWAGDPRQSEPNLNRIDRRRSTTLDDLAPLFGIDGVSFVSFQLGAARDQLAAARWPVVDAMKGVTDFADTAARLAGVDLLISVDTSMAHLAGGLGMPVWMLSRFDGCWRWLEQRADTPWYASMRIFRQPCPGDWASVVAEVGAALGEVVDRRVEC